MIRRTFTVMILLTLAAAAGCAGNKAAVGTMTPEQYLEQAQRQFQNKRYEEARETLKEARRRTRSGDMDAQMLKLLGDVEFRDENWTVAIETYGEFIKLHPRHAMAPAVQFQIGVAYSKLIRPRDRNPQPAYLAREAFRRVVDLFPRSPEARSAPAQIETCNKAIAESEMFVGQFYFRKENWRGAINRFDVIIREYPRSGFEEEALWLTAESYREMKDAAKAEEYGRMLLEKYPTGTYARKVRERK
jgi:outer membrane protein assembly factor BamD